LFTLGDDQQTIVRNRSKTTLTNGSEGQKQKSDSASEFKSYVSNGTGKLPMPLPPQDDYDRVPLGPPIPIAKRTSAVVL
jgi:hypothetical protein